MEQLEVARCSGEQKNRKASLASQNYPRWPKRPSMRHRQRGFEECATKREKDTGWVGGERHLIDSIIMRGLSWTIVDYHGLPLMLMDYGLSRVNVAYPGLAWISIDYYGSSWILTEYGLSLVAVDYHG